MERINETEILESGDIPDEVANRVYRDLFRIHWCLGNIQFVIRAIRRDAIGAQRILDVGCGTALVSSAISRRLNIDALGVDLEPRPVANPSVRVIKADAIRDPLPAADVAFSMLLGHHLSEDELVKLIRNVGEYCRRFILLDLVRHPLPLALFRLFVSPFVCRTAAIDGQRSIRRSYTPSELYRITVSALAGSTATFQQSVTTLYTRQVIDICYAPPSSHAAELNNE